MKGVKRKEVIFETTDVNSMLFLAGLSKYQNWAVLLNIKKQIATAYLKHPSTSTNKTISNKANKYSNI